MTAKHSPLPLRLDGKHRSIVLDADNLVFAGCYGREANAQLIVDAVNSTMGAQVQQDEDPLPLLPSCCSTNYWRLDSRDKQERIDALDQQNASLKAALKERTKELAIVEKERDAWRDKDQQYNSRQLALAAENERLQAQLAAAELARYDMERDRDKWIHTAELAENDLERISAANRDVAAERGPTVRELGAAADRASKATSMEILGVVGRFDCGRLQMWRRFCNTQEVFREGVNHMRIENEVMIYCRKCSNVLDAECEVNFKDGTTLKIHPCEACLDKAKDAGYEEAQ